MPNKRAVPSQKGGEALRKAVASRLKEVRRLSGRLQEEAAADYGIRYPTYRDYENARSLPSGESMEKFGKAGINLNWLMLGEGPMRRVQVQVSTEDDMVMLRKVIIEVERMTQELGLSSDPERKAGLITRLLYEKKQPG